MADEQPAPAGYAAEWAPTPVGWGEFSFDTYLRANWPKDNTTVLAIFEMLVDRTGEWARYTRDQIGNHLFKALARATRETFPFENWTQPMLRDEIFVRCNPEQLNLSRRYFEQQYGTHREPMR